jgi:hypothetical protein
MVPTLGFVSKAVRSSRGAVVSIVGSACGRVLSGRCRVLSGLGGC